MLTATDRVLIAASLDGDHAIPERLRLLLDRSREARQLLERLRRERDALTNLPQRKAPSSLLPAVIARISDLTPWDAIPSTVRTPATRRWLPTAIAASVAILAGLAVWYGVQVNHHSVLVQSQAQALPNVDEPQPLEVSPEVLSHIPPVEPSGVVATSLEIAPAPHKPGDPPREVYGAPFVPLPKLDAILVRLPTIAAFAELSREDVQKQLALELAKPGPVRIDLFSRDSLKAAEMLVATGRAAGVNVMLDAVAQERLRRRMPTTWVIYTDSLTPREAMAWLLRLAAADSKPSEGSSPKPIFHTLHLPDATGHDAKDLKDLLGLEPAKAKPAKANPTKPISAGTLSELSASLQKDKFAILVSAFPPSSRVNPSQSKDIKAWLDGRGDRKPGTVALHITVR